MLKIIKFNTMQNRNEFCKHFLDVIKIHDVAIMRIIIWFTDENNVQCIADIIEIEPRKFLIKSKPGVSTYITKWLEKYFGDDGYSMQFELKDPQDVEEEENFGH